MLSPLTLYFLHTKYRWSKDLGTNFTLDNCLFGSIKLTKNADPDKYKYSSYGIGFDSRSLFSFTDGSMGKNFINYALYISSSVQANNKNRNILILGKGQTKGLGNTSPATEAEYSINFTQSNRNFKLSLHYNGSFLFVNAT